MDNCHHASHSPTPPKIARPPLAQKTIFDKTKLSVDRSIAKTTTYGRKSLFQLDSINQNCAIFTPTSTRLFPFPRGKGLGVSCPAADTVFDPPSPPGGGRRAS